VTEGSWRPVLIVASDGAHVPTRPKAKRNEKRGKGRWQEAKGFRIYLLGKDRIAHVASWHQIQNGAWWVKETGNEMLGNRCAIYNGTCGKIFEKYKKAQNPL